MAGYEYRPTPARKRQAEEFSRRRSMVEAKKAARVVKPKKETPVKQNKMDDSVIDEFAVFPAEPPESVLGTGQVREAATKAIAVMKKHPNEWFQIANRGTRKRASSYASQVQKYAGGVRVQTRTSVKDGRGLLFARVVSDD